MAITPRRPKWKDTMTDKERFNNQMHYKPIDRFFNMEFGYWEKTSKLGTFSAITISQTTPRQTLSSTLIK